MYFPYFRGKQYELLTIRETSKILSENGFVPIIEAVRPDFGGLSRALDDLRLQEGKAVVIINPEHGSVTTSDIIEFLNNYRGYEGFVAGILLTGNMDLDNALELCNKRTSHKKCLIHSGFSSARDLSDGIKENPEINMSVFSEDFCGKLYQKHFSNHETRVLIRDGFTSRRNKDHPDTPEWFSDLHVTFPLENMSGFGDFLIVGDEYSEAGGPAYTVAIHITFIDYDSDEEMKIWHFKSDRQNTPKDPAGKFAEALQKLIEQLDTGRSGISETESIKEFRDLHYRGHYPGLGYLKKLSMKHHIETLAEYFQKQA